MMKNCIAWKGLCIIIVLGFIGCGRGNINNNGQIFSTSKAITAFSILSPAAEGTINENLKTISVTVPYGTPVSALTAIFNETGTVVKVGSTVQVSGSTANDFTRPVSYDVFAEDGSHATYIVTVTVTASNSKAITAFSILSPAVEGTINENLKTISVTVPYGTPVTALIAIFNATGTVVKVGSTVQVGGSTANDFTSPVFYDVFAENGSHATYIVTVTVSEPQSSTKAITAFSIDDPAAMGIINEGSKTIYVIVPKGTNRTSLTAVFTTTGANVKVGNILQTSGSTTNDFTNTVMYTVTAADGSTAIYSVHVLIQNYVDLQSDAGDYIGAGKTYSYTQADAQIVLSATGNHLSLNITGDQDWWSDYQTPNTVSQLQPGTYNNLTRYPFNDPAVGGLDWYGEGRGCNTLTGWFVIDDAAYSNGILTEIDLHFEQHCEGGTAALHGQIHWTSSDTTTPAGPVNPPPAGLWQPVSGSTPTTGNYVYLKSDAGDYIGAGRTYTYTQADAQIVTTEVDNRFSITITGDQQWTGDFQAMSSLTQLEPGYYGNLQRYPFNNPTRGGLDWYGEGRGCNTLTGWFVVDNITFSNGTLTAIDLRFEQHCEGGTAALHGQIHWTSSDTTTPAGPVNPPPAGLWQPVSGSTPTTGNYVYLQSDSGDYIGAGQTYTYTPSDSQITLSTNGGLFTLNISGTKYWTGNFKAMNSLTQLEPGYYGNLQRYPFNNPTRGGLDWSGDGRGCNTLTGWFVVDNVTYSGTTIKAIDLRFEQHCEGASPALHGQIHWTQ